MEPQAGARQSNPARSDPRAKRSASIGGYVPPPASVALLQVPTNRPVETQESSLQHAARPSAQDSPSRAHELHVPNKHEPEQHSASVLQSLPEQLSPGLQTSSSSSHFRTKPASSVLSESNP